MSFSRCFYATLLALICTANNPLIFVNKNTPTVPAHNWPLHPRLNNVPTPERLNKPLLLDATQTYEPGRLQVSTDSLLEQEPVFSHDDTTSFILRLELWAHPWFSKTGGYGQRIDSGAICLQFLDGVGINRNGAASPEPFLLTATPTKHHNPSLTNIIIQVLLSLSVPSTTFFCIDVNALIAFYIPIQFVNLSESARASLIKAFITTVRLRLMFTIWLTLYILLGCIISDYGVATSTAADLSHRSVLRPFKYVSTLSTNISKRHCPAKTVSAESFTITVILINIAYSGISSIFPRCIIFGYKIKFAARTAAILHPANILRTYILNYIDVATFSTVALFRHDIQPTHQDTLCYSYNRTLAPGDPSAPNPPPKPRPLQPTTKPRTSKYTR